MNILFLDYDGVVNTLMWDAEGKKTSFNFPHDNKVNNFQAVQWVSKFCKEKDYKIVVTSTWRVHENYKECLINGGLWKDVEIIGQTPVSENRNRELEIKEYIEEHNIKNFIIVDDENVYNELESHFIECDMDIGFTFHQYIKCCKFAEKYESEGYNE